MGLRDSLEVMRSVPPMVAMLVLAGGCRVGYERLMLTARDGAPMDDASSAARDGSIAIADADGSAAAMDGSSSQDAGPEPEACTEIPRLADPVSIDGSLEPGLSLGAIAPLGWMGTIPDVPPGHTAEFAAAWTTAGLYVFVHVVDPRVYPPPSGDSILCGDMIDIYVDADARYPRAPDNEFPGARRFLVAAPDGTNRAELSHRAGGVPVDDGAWTSASHGAFIVADGYVVEALISASDLGASSWQLAQGRTIGLDLAISFHDPISVGCADQNYQGTFYWRLADAGCEYPFCNTLAYCNARLGP